MADIHITQPDPHHEEHPQHDLDALLEHIKRNPLLYIAGVAFILLAVVAGFLVQASNVAQDREASAQYLQALRTEDPVLRVAELEAVAGTGSRRTDSALYLAAESAYRAQNAEQAKALFERLRNEFPDSRHVADAVEGLGFIAENAGEPAQALAYYQEIVEKWPLAFAARRQEFNIGRVREQLGEFQAAAEAYRSQVLSFPESSVAARAQQALDALLAAHPEVVLPDLAPVEASAAEEAPAEEAVVIEDTEDAAAEPVIEEEEPLVVVEDLEDATEDAAATVEEVPEAVEPPAGETE